MNITTETRRESYIDKQQKVIEKIKNYCIKNSDDESENYKGICFVKYSDEIIKIIKNEE